MKGSYLLGNFPRMVYRIGSRVLLSCFGLDSDARLLGDIIKERISSHQLLSYQDISSVCSSSSSGGYGEGGGNSVDNVINLEPENIARIISDILYNKKLLLSPLIVGMDKKNVPYIASMDGLGAMTVSSKFAVSGTSNGGLYSILEGLYKSDLSADELVELAEKCIKMALQRDCISGGMVRLYTIYQNKLYCKEISTDDV